MYNEVRPVYVVVYYYTVFFFRLSIPIKNKSLISVPFSSKQHRSFATYLANTTLFRKNIIYLYYIGIKHNMKSIVHVSLGTVFGLCVLAITVSGQLLPENPISKSTEILSDILLKVCCQLADHSRL